MASGGPIVINYSANTADAVKGTDELSTAVGKTADAADDAQSEIGKSAEKGLAAQKKAAQGVIQATRDAARQQIQEWANAAVQQGQDADKVQRKVEVLYNKIEADAREASTTVEQSSASGWSKAQAAVEGFGGKVGGVLQTAGSALGSFDGSIGSVGTTISGLAALIPGVGGLIGGVLGGIASKMFQDWDANSKASAQAVSDMYADMIESGNNYVSEQQISKAIQDIIGDAERLDQVKGRAEQAGVSIQTALRAEAGDPNALRTVIDGASAALDRLKASGESATGLAVTTTEKTIQHYKDVGAATDTAASKAELYRQSISNTAQSVATAGDAVNKLNEQIRQTPTTRDLKVNVTGLDGVAAKLDAITRDRTVNVTVRSRAGDRVF